MSELANNKKALFEYEILEKFEAGLVLTGQEVQSVRGGHMSLKGAYITFHNGEAFLTGAHISKYKPAGSLPEYDPERSRKVLLKASEIRYLQGKTQEKGLTIVPVSVYTKNHFIKIEIAIGRGRHKYDKRDVIKKRDIAKEIKRSLKFWPMGVPCFDSGSLSYWHVEAVQGLVNRLNNLISANLFTKVKNAVANSFGAMNFAPAMA